MTDFKFLETRTHLETYFHEQAEKEALRLRRYVTVTPPGIPRKQYIHNVLLNTDPATGYFRESHALVAHIIQTELLTGLERSLREDQGTDLAPSEPQPYVLFQLEKFPLTLFRVLPLYQHALQLASMIEHQHPQYLRCSSPPLINGISLYLNEHGLAYAKALQGGELNEPGLNHHQRTQRKLQDRHWKRRTKTCTTNHH